MMTMTTAVCRVCGDDIVEVEPGEWVHSKRARSGRPWAHEARPVPAADDVAADS